MSRSIRARYSSAPRAEADRVARFRQGNEELARTLEEVRAAAPGMGPLCDLLVASGDQPALADSPGAKARPAPGLKAGDGRSSLLLLALDGPQEPWTPAPGPRGRDPRRIRRARAARAARQARAARAAQQAHWAQQQAAAIAAAAPAATRVWRE